MTYLLVNAESEIWVTRARADTTLETGWARVVASVRRVWKGPGLWADVPLRAWLRRSARKHRISGRRARLSSEGGEGAQNCEADRLHGVGLQANGVGELLAR